MADASGHIDGGSYAGLAWAGAALTVAAVWSVFFSTGISEKLAVKIARHHYRLSTANSKSSSEGLFGAGS